MRAYKLNPYIIVRILILKINLKKTSIIIQYKLEFVIFNLNIQMFPIYSFKAGRFVINAETKKVKPDKAKGKIII